eukprot:m.1214 g.1214  ORF g.1214 m.1214 type:complete len:221 (+) comp5895_c0_seq1:156-818(+)
MEDAEEILKLKFFSLLHPAPSLARQWWDVIRSKYTESQRHYHTLCHLTEMMHFLVEYSDALRHPESVAMAIFFHDVIYDPTRKDNEEQSAALYDEFASMCNEGVKLLHLKIKELILQTKCHSTEVNHASSSTYGTQDEHYFLDFDMAILGSPEEDYLKYANQIRKEYSHVPAEAYCTGRCQVLEGFLSTNNIYNTKEFQCRFEEQARQNMRKEIDRLQSK